MRENGQIRRRDDPSPSSSPLVQNMKQRLAMTPARRPPETLALFLDLADSSPSNVIFLLIQHLAKSFDTAVGQRGNHP